MDAEGETAASRTPGTEAVLRRVRDVADATRLRKIIPLMLIPATASWMANPRPPVYPLLLATVFVLVVGAFGMKLNVLADRELDRHSKPGLYARLARDARMTRGVLAIEGAACAALLVLSALSTNRGVATALLVCGALFLLYSHNFLAPGRETERRLKVYWWGNGITVAGGYCALWLLGFAVAGVDWLLPRDLPWVFVGVAFALLDYAVFLNECGLDSTDERRLLPHTLPSLLGQRGVAVAALGVWAIGGAACLVSSSMPARGKELALATGALPMVVVAAGLVCAFFVNARSTGAGSSERRLRERLIDLYFTATRIGIACFVAFARLIPHG